MTLSPEEKRPPFPENLKTPELLQALFNAQSAAIKATAACLPLLAKAVDAAALRLKNKNGRLIYTGAGTSARLLTVDMSELPPTFGFDEKRLITLPAGGREAFFRAKEGAEDDKEAAKQAVRGLNLTVHDVILGMAAGGTTPFTAAALAEAAQSEALIIAVANRKETELPLFTAASDRAIKICLPTGPEFIDGSTRMAAGTAQKVFLTLFSTSLMIRLHRTFQGRMVDLTVTNQKLRKRAEDMLAALTDAPAEARKAVLIATDFRVKPAVLTLQASCSLQAAEALLEQCNGDLAEALKKACPPEKK